jgi:hypothetical protein
MTTPEMSQLSVGQVTVWDFGFRYNLAAMDLPELEALMGKFEEELRLASTSLSTGASDRFGFAQRPTLSYHGDADFDSAQSPLTSDRRSPSEVEVPNYWQITEILGKIYREIMNRRLVNYWGTLEYKQNHI